MNASGSPETSYMPGEWVVVAAAGVWLLADINRASSAVQEWWSAVRGGASAVDVLALVLEEGFRAVPNFAIMGFDHVSGTGTVAVRGSATIALIGQETTSELTGANTSTWRQSNLDASLNAVELRSEDVPAGGVRLPLTIGVSVASDIRIDLRVQTSTDAPPSRNYAPLPGGVPLLTLIVHEFAGDVGR